ncbi:MAG: hypothetical protein CMM07_06725 [Rhodopirellula sp.]|nr:hypothetical protein [Rhodopirellula sp.]
MTMEKLLTTVVVFTTCVACAFANADEAGQLEFFESKIRPVLVEHCYPCHSIQAGKSKGGLLLDSRHGWQVGGDSGPAIIPFKPEESLVLLAINQSGESSEMPPDKRLSQTIVKNFEAWITVGAIDPRNGQKPPKTKQMDIAAGKQFWSFQPLQRSFEHHSIDEFIQPQAPVAPANTLARRLFLDLIGLPPSPNELHEFAQIYSDISPDKAVQTFTDKLLSRKEFGEKWARHWMDIARYADSNGGDFNLTYPESWRYRNYLIDAFNSDMPYDQFVREQIAGDLLPASGTEERNRQMIATGFLMVAPKMLTERNKAKMHLDIADEQVDTIGRAILGLTLGCARCHDHKFDPIPTKDYYAMLGILHSTRTADGILMGNVNVSGWKETDLEVDSQTRQRHAQLKARTTAIEQELKQKQEKYQKLQTAGSVLVDDPAAEKTGKWRKSTFRPNHIGSHYLVADKNPLESLSIRWQITLPKPGQYEIRVSFGGGQGLEKKAPYVVTHAKGETELIIDQTVNPPINGMWYSLGTFTFAASPPENGSGKEKPAPVYAQVELSNRNTTGPVIADAVQIVPIDSVQANAQDEQVDSLRATIERLQSELKGLEAQQPKIAKAMVAADHSGDRLGDLQIRIRGETKNLGAKARRGFLQVVSSTDAEEPIIAEHQSGRIELAEWLTNPDNPLTSRVMVNRIWQQFFGRGIVSTTDNFGIRGTTPTHPILLDFLAENLVNNRWSVKSLIRKIVQSKTYQQTSSAISSSDPENKFLRRQNCRPASAEVIRDSILAITGELNREQHESAVASLGMYAIETSGKRDPSVGKTGDLRQRSVYMPVIRGAVPPSLAIFDLPNPDLVTGTRAETTVPAQALFMMNSQFIQEMSQALSARICAEHETTAPLIQDLYQRVLIRSADQDDISKASEYIIALINQGKSRQAAVASFVQILFSSTEFRFVE